mmetsp:Transcript_21624/g.38830  ORF Transcript_21624/g.38830 Transcript_21624/m.38830 type:complete len:297 (-) Transcript_21624:1754-2644(-)
MPNNKMWCFCDDSVPGASHSVQEQQQHREEYIAWMERKLLRETDRANAAETTVKTYQVKLKRMEANSHPGPTTGVASNQGGTKSEREERQDLLVAFLENRLENAEKRIQEQQQDLASYQAKLSQQSAKPISSGLPSDEGKHQELTERLILLEKTKTHLEDQVKSSHEAKAKADLKILELQGQLNSVEPNSANQLREKDALLTFLEGALERTEANYTELEKSMRELEKERATWHSKSTGDGHGAKAKGDRSLDVEEQRLLINFLEGTVARLEAQLQGMHEQNMVLQSLVNSAQTETD